MAPYFGRPLQKLNQSQIQFFFFNSPNTNTNLMRNNNTNSNNNSNKQTSPDNDDSWEIRAFEEDTTGNLLGCTWPPRSYTCTFCRREFRSAQALGGHMNVHRRDRARLHDAPLPPPPAQPLLIQTGRANGFCILYPLPNPNSILSPLLPNDTTTNSVVSSVSNTEPSNSNDNNNDENTKVVFAVEEELDLELRLGRKPAEK